MGHRRTAAEPGVSHPGSAAPALDLVFAALSDATRRGILARLAQGPCSVSRLGEPFPVSAPAISKHLLVLERSGLIERWKQGRVHFCRLLDGPLRQAGDWIERHQAFWEQQLDALEEYLDREDDPCPDPLPRPRSRRSSSAAVSARRRNGSSGHGRSRKP
jgi:DNA-binding transcriptional ArsR family regulator